MPCDLVVDLRRVRQKLDELYPTAEKHLDLGLPPVVNDELKWMQRREPCVVVSLPDGVQILYNDKALRKLLA